MKLLEGSVENRTKELQTELKDFIETLIPVDSDGLKLVIQDSVAYLVIDGKEVMSSSPSAVSDMISDVNYCPEKAKVFIGGLGLGIILLALSRFHRPVEVVVCEIDSRVIDAVSLSVIEYFSEHYPLFNLKIIEGDAAVEISKLGRFDWIYEDFLKEQTKTEYNSTELKAIFLSHLTARGVYTSFFTSRVHVRTSPVKDYWRPT